MLSYPGILKCHYWFCWCLDLFCSIVQNVLTSNSLNKLLFTLVTCKRCSEYSIDLVRLKRRFLIVRVPISRNSLIQFGLHLSFSQTINEIPLQKYCCPIFHSLSIKQHSSSVACVLVARQIFVCYF